MSYRRKQTAYHTERSQLFPLNQDDGSLVAWYTTSQLFLWRKQYRKEVLLLWLFLPLTCCRHEIKELQRLLGENDGK